MPETKEITPVEWEHLVPPIFAACVDREAARFNLARPFVVDGFLYASDGRVAIRMPVPEAWAIPNEGRIVKGIVDVFMGTYQADPVPIPEVVGECAACKGGGRLASRECPDCGGSGEDADPDCECPHCTGSHYCVECEGTGGVPEGPCGECDGSGILNANRSVRVAPGFDISRKNAAMLARHGATAHLPAEYAAPGHKPLRFTVGDVEGRLMPMTRDPN